MSWFFNFGGRRRSACTVCNNLTDAHASLLVLLPDTARYIPGIDNTLADALSRNNATLFLSKVPNVDKTATHVSQELMELLVIWTS